MSSNFKVPPSSLLLPIPGQDLPAEDLIRQVLFDIDPELKQNEIDEDYGDGIPWMLSVNLNGFPHPVYIWPELVDEIPSEAWWVSVESLEMEREAFSGCSVGLIIETQLEGGDPRDLWRNQVVLARSLWEGAPFVYDDNAYRIVTLLEIDSMIEMQIKPSAQQLMSLHAVFDEDVSSRLWLHTHGLSRAGISDLEMIAVKQPYKHSASRLMSICAERQIDGLLNPGRPLEVAPGVFVDTIPLNEALALIDEAELGGSLDREQSHSDPRLILVPPVRREHGGLSFFPTPRRTLSTDPIMTKLENQDLIYYTDVEVQRMASLARYRWPVFLTLWRENKDANWIFLVKIPFRTASDSSESKEEHIWFRVLNIDHLQLTVQCENEPMDIPKLQIGSMLTIKPDEITDWNVATPEGVFDPLSAVALTPQNSMHIVASRPIH